MWCRSSVPSRGRPGVHDDRHHPKSAPRSPFTPKKASQGPVFKRSGPEVIKKHMIMTPRALEEVSRPPGDTPRALEETPRASGHPPEAPHDTLGGVGAGVGHKKTGLDAGRGQVRSVWGAVPLQERQCLYGLPPRGESIGLIRAPIAGQRAPGLPGLASITLIRPQDLAVSSGSVRHLGGLVDVSPPDIGCGRCAEAG